ncbi:MerC domain-containing protein [Sphingomonas crusticola]|uniref:MerC domain-containing protein n=1 Tax=Sphingomonas crusticola TaxID=1697973 RepID=UPI001F07D3B8|nr:MerC domain-containing protein [Sphingomonas crusticola]
MRSRADLIEGIAVGATIACLIHCLVLPLLIAVLPVLSSVLPIPEHFHLIALALAIPATAGALFAGYRRHRLAGPLIAGTIGLALLALAAIHWGETPLEMPVTVLGSIAIAIAHLTNWRFRRASHLTAA